LQFARFRHFRLLFADSGRGIGPDGTSGRSPGAAAGMAAGSSVRRLDFAGQRSQDLGAEPELSFCGGLPGFFGVGWKHL
jgi:hypothetical protein